MKAKGQERVSNVIDLCMLMRELGYFPTVDWASFIRMLFNQREDNACEALAATEDQAATNYPDAQASTSSLVLSSSL